MIAPEPGTEPAAIALRPTSPTSGSLTGSLTGSVSGRSLSGGGTNGSASVLPGGTVYPGSAIVAGRVVAAALGVDTLDVRGVIAPMPSSSRTECSRPESSTGVSQSGERSPISVAPNLVKVLRARSAWASLAALTHTSTAPRRTASA